MRRGTDLPSHGASPFHSMSFLINVFAIQRKDQGNFPMLRTATCLAAMLLVAGTLHTASAQTAAPAPAAAKPSKMKLTAEKLKDMKAKWTANKGKLKTC